MGPGGDEGRDDHDDDRDDDLGAEDPDGPLAGDDDVTLGAPPDRMDRLWVHPAELSAVAPPAPDRRSRVSTLVVPIAAGALGALAAVLVLGLIGAFDRGSDARANQRAQERVAEEDAAVSEVARIVAPGLVLVSASDAAGTRQSTGVCVRHRGDVVTSGATVGAATTAQLTTSEGETITAQVIGRDEASGLVLLDAGQPLRAVPVSEEIARVGDSVWIFGARPPRESSPWISGGLVSSADAVLANLPGPMTGGLLETDALGTMWTAGGALVDRTGSVTGIVLSPQGEHHGAFAVPIERAVDVADQIRESGYVEHGALPFDGVDTPSGRQVVAVAPDGAAARAGLLPGDVIRSVDDRAAVDLAALTAILHAYAPGSDVELSLLRSGEPMNLDVTLDSTQPAVASPG